MIGLRRGLAAPENFMRAALALAALVALTVPAALVAAAAAPPPAGLYGLSARAALVRVLDNGTTVAVGAPACSDCLLAQGLSTLDAAGAVFYSVLYDEATRTPMLTGLALATGAVVSSVALPFVEPVTPQVGVGLWLAFCAATGRVLAGGQDASQAHVMGAVDPRSGDFRRFASINASAHNNVGCACEAAYVPSTDEVVLQLGTHSPLPAGIDIFAVNVGTGAVRFTGQSASRNIVSLSYAADADVVVGLGINFAGGALQRTVSRLDPLSLRIDVVGNVSAETIASCGIAAYNSATRGLYWIGDRTGNDAFELVQSSVADASLISTGALCATDPECPWSLEYFPGSADTAPVERAETTAPAERAETAPAETAPAETAPAETASILPPGGDAYGFGLVRASDFGCVADGVADDAACLQAAIDAARNASRTLYLARGTYRISRFLDWGLWTPISVRGGEPGNAGVAGSATGVAIVADAAVGGGAVHDFTGSGYGSVEGIAFSGGRAMAQVLNGRTAAGGYGSGIVWRACNFAPPGAAGAMAFVNHMGEVLTWRDCRFLGQGAPALLVTWRAPHWNVTAPSGRALATSVSLTVFRLDGGDLTGDNCALLTLDTEGQPNQGTALTVTGTYFANSGDQMAAIEVRGAWRNVVIAGVRLENDGGGPPVQHMTFLRLAGAGALLQHFSVAAYGDGDATWPLVSGAGDLEGGSLIGHAQINVTGSLKAVDITTSDTLALVVSGDVANCRARAAGGTVAADGVSVGGRLELDDGRGGALVHLEAVASAPGGAWSAADADGLFEASFLGTRMLLHVSSGGGARAASVLSFADVPPGRLSLSGLLVRAAFDGGAGDFVVRRLSA